LLKVDAMITVRGIYENGVVKLLEKPPAMGTQKVLITFLDETEDDAIRKLTQYQYTEEFQQYLEDPAEDVYQDYLKSKNEDR
jgi:predicted DNA-binding antitoxin AbrB/MazE fold protein